MNDLMFNELSISELEMIDGGVKPSSVCYFIAGVAACYVSPVIGVPFFLLSFNYANA